MMVDGEDPLMIYFTQSHKPDRNQAGCDLQIPTTYNQQRFIYFAQVLEESDWSLM